MGKQHPSRSPEHRQKKKDKKSRKQRRRSHSSSSSVDFKRRQQIQKNREPSNDRYDKNLSKSKNKQKYRDRDRDYYKGKSRERSHDRRRSPQRDTRREHKSRHGDRDRKSRQRSRSRSKHNKDRKSKERSRSKSKSKVQPKEQRKVIKEQAKSQLINKKKSRSPSPIVSRNLTEEERMKKLAMRKVKARLMKLNDLLDGDNSQSDSSQDMKAPHKPTTTSSSSGLPPPMPKLPPMPSIGTSNKKQEQTPIIKPKGKKESRWGKTTAVEPTIMHTSNQEQDAASKNRTENDLQNKLSLQPDHSEDIRLSLSEDKSIEQEVPANTSNSQHLHTINQEDAHSQQVDPLDEYMMEIQGQAAQQIQLPKNQKKKIITFDEVVISNSLPIQEQTRAKAPIASEPINGDQTEVKKQENQTVEEDQQQQNFRNIFLKAIQRIGQKQPGDAEDGRGTMMQNNQDIQEQLSDLEDNKKDDELDFFAKQRRMAERKELNAIDHSKIQYEDVKFNLYREAEQVSRLNPKDVQKYRKQAGDIKVRGKDVLNPVFNWYQCGLNDKLLAVIEKRQYGKPFPIQAQSLPLIMSGRDVIGIAQTGSGKTLSYLLPVLRHILSQKPVEEGEGPISIIMTPTRELARQVYQEAKTFCKSTHIRILAVYGGLSVQGQLSDFRKGAELVICTPGRMIDILTLNKGKITNLKRVTMIVIDEADRMFDLGFEPQISRIIENSRPKKQVVMFSATFPKNVEGLARRILVSPVEIIVGGRGQACRNVEQQVIVLEQTSKFLKLLQILGLWNDKGSILVFVDKQTQVDFLFQQLIKYGYNPLTLHGAMDADDRQHTIYDFKKGLSNLMIATSILARGLDVKAICLVVNFKCPNHLEDYIHRIGRTGRAGTKGTAITFITSQEEQYSIDLIKALEMSEIHPPEELKKLSQEYLAKVKKGQARKIKNRNTIGNGFKFDQEEEEKVNQLKSAIKSQLKHEGLAGFEDSDEEDIQMKKKKEENIRGRSQQDRVAQVLKNPQIKGKLVSQAVKAVSDAMKSGQKLNTQKILDIAIQSIKGSVGKHKIANTVEQGVEKVSQLINQFQNKGIEGADFFSYDFQINDYPNNARQKACNQSFLHQVQHQTNCSVSLRGVYVEPGKKVPIGCRKLYLHIQGENKYYVTTAYKQIKGVIQENAYQSMHAGHMPGKYNV